MTAQRYRILLFFLIFPVLAVHLSALDFARDPFSQPLPIPPLIEDENPKTPVLEATLTAEEGGVTYFIGTETPTYGYNGSFLGPTIRAARGQRVKITVANKLKEVTTLHWHGLHVPAEMDGGPHQGILPGSEWKTDFIIKQEAATLWYHPHALGKTGEHVYKGLAGLFIIDDSNSESLDLPKEYGVDDIPLILQDRRFYADGSFAYIQNRADVMHGVIGNVLLVNGEIKPFLKTNRNLLRLRILNGSNAGLYRISAGSRPLLFIASDGGFLEKPVAMDQIVLSPGERGEVLLDIRDLSPGEELYLDVEEFNGNRFQALKIIKTAGKNEPPPVPGKLNSVKRINVSEADTIREFALETRGMGVFSINGKQMDMSRIDEVVTIGATEMWILTNRGMGMMNLPHSFHVHDVQFQIVSRDGKRPPLHELGWKDTVLVWPGEKVQIISRFEDFTGLYMYHCHMLEHEDAGMMGQFKVIPD